MDKIISTENLNKCYGENRAVDNVSISVEKGEIYGFLGLNGAGKTTTIRMLLGMVTPTSGACRLCGKKVSSGSVSLWKDVGYMVETPYSYPELTVRENLEIIRQLRGLPGKAVDQIMEQLKLSQYANRKARHLSLGNAQRLGIAKALIHNPAILILDEPTNGLDPAGIVEVRDLLRNLAEKQGVTVLISSHILGEISKLVNRIGIIHKGRLLKEMSTADLDAQLHKILTVDGRNREGIATALQIAGFTVVNESGMPLQIIGGNVPENAEQIVTMLVNKELAPTHFVLEKEDLEQYFLRIVGNSEGVAV